MPCHVTAGRISASAMTPICVILTAAAVLHRLVASMSRQGCAPIPIHPLSPSAQMSPR